MRFWKERPSFARRVFLFDPESIREVYVVPNFISEGYFTQTVVPRELELNGPITKRSNGQLWKYLSRWKFIHCDGVTAQPCERLSHLMSIGRDENANGRRTIVNRQFRRRHQRSAPRENKHACSIFR